MLIFIGPGKFECILLEFGSKFLKNPGHKIDHASSGRSKFTLEECFGFVSQMDPGLWGLNLS